MHMLSLEGKSALVTGAGRGIGRATAALLARSGAAVMVADVDAAALRGTMGALASVGHKAAQLSGDLTDPAFPQQLVDAVLGSFGALDIIVNNAGYTWDGVIQKTTDEHFQAMLDVHLVAPFRILRAASAWLRKQAKKETTLNHRVMRKVVNVTSISALDGNAGQLGYTAGKAGLVGLTKTLAKEWGRYNVNVNAVAFGMIDTRLTQPRNAEASRIRINERQIPVGLRADTLEAARRQNPLGRFGTPEEAAGAILFFSSPLSDYVTGEVLVCSGGMDRYPATFC
jgi:3-oxoacyl-[acyl-carrier protein] reductase